eukprot:6214344-Pleurochrysis_carterae.AAC.3
MEAACANSAGRTSELLLDEKRPWSCQACRGAAVCAIRLRTRRPIACALERPLSVDSGRFSSLTAIMARGSSETAISGTVIRGTLGARRGRRMADIMPGEACALNRLRAQRWARTLDT